MEQEKLAEAKSMLNDDKTKMDHTLNEIDKETKDTQKLCKEKIKEK